MPGFIDKLRRRLNPNPLRRYPTATRLPAHFEVDALARALDGLPADWWHAHLGPYHDGGWEAIALWAPDGDRRNQTSHGGAFAATEALQRLPGFRDVIDAIPGLKHRVRLMRLRAGARILRHSDPMSQIDATLVRLHVPIATHPQVDFRVNDRSVRMQPGELWHVDVRFPHEVHNGGTQARVHLVVDALRNAQLSQWLRQGEAVQQARLTRYFLKHLLPGRLLLRLGWAN